MNNEAARPVFGPDFAVDKRTTIRILLIEDSPVDATVALAMLQVELPDATVRLARTLAEAIDILQAQDHDVVLTDLSLPDAHGLEAVSELRRGREDLVAIVMTADNDRQLGLRALDCGADDFLVKGQHDARGLATAILYALQRRLAAVEARHYERLAVEFMDSIDANTCAVDRTGTIVAVNRAWTDYAAANGGPAGWTGLGTNVHELCGLADGPDGAQAREVSQGLNAVLSGDLPRYVREHYCVGQDSEQAWFSLRVNPMPSGGAVMSYVDVTDTKTAQLALAHQALHDPLTGLPNRALVEDRLQQALNQPSCDGRQVAVAFLDLDAFKRINDSLGHAQGDVLLQLVAARLQGGVRECDTVSRIAADEFVVILPGVAGESEAEALSRGLLQCFVEPFTLANAAVTVSASLGIVLGENGQAADEILITADAAMYDAKRHGRGRIRKFSGISLPTGKGNVQLEAELRQALVRDELELHYQPVIDLDGGAVTGVEALVRWRSPAGLRFPDTFIPVAEATGLIIDIGAWVTNEACRQSALWHRQGLDLDMAINLSARQVSHPDVVATLRDAMLRHDVPASRLVAEVTESTMVEDAEAAQLALTQLADMGVRVAIDDFGTGYSSLVYLKRYPVHALKVDRSFVSGIGTSERDAAIVASIVSLARAVGAVCIAEGVETREQQAHLASLGCEQVQGYLFSRAVPADMLPDAIATCEVILSVPIPRVRSGARSVAGSRSGSGAGARVARGGRKVAV